MIATNFREFVDRVMDRGHIDENDVSLLHDDVLADRVLDRDTIDVLIAMERAVPKACVAFHDRLVALVVDYAVWENRPTGVIDRDKANWLVTTLSAGEGPTATALRIAFEVVREADRCDEALVAFAMRKPGGRFASHHAPILALAS